MVVFLWKHTQTQTHTDAHNPRGSTGFLGRETTLKNPSWSVDRTLSDCTTSNPYLKRQQVNKNTWLRYYSLKNYWAFPYQAITITKEAVETLSKPNWTYPLWALQWFYELDQLWSFLRGRWSSSSESTDCTPSITLDHHMWSSVTYSYRQGGSPITWRARRRRCSCPWPPRRQTRPIRAAPRRRAAPIRRTNGRGSTCQRRAKS